MITSNDSTLTRVKALPIRARAAFALAVAEMVVLELAEDPVGLRVAQDALRLSWQWAGGAPVKAEEIDQYIGASADKILATYDVSNHKEEMRAAMAVAIYAVAFVCRKAYEAEISKAESDEAERIRSQISEPMWEVEADIPVEMLKFAKQTSRYSEEAVQRVIRFISQRHAGQGPETLGERITADDVLPLISGSPRKMS